MNSAVLVRGIPRRDASILAIRAWSKFPNNELLQDRTYRALSRTEEKVVKRQSQTAVRLRIIRIRN